MKGPSYFSESLGTGVNLNVQLLVNTQNLRTHMCLDGMPNFFFKRFLMSTTRLFLQGTGRCLGA